MPVPSPSHAFERALRISYMYTKYKRSYEEVIHISADSEKLSLEAK